MPPTLYEWLGGRPVLDRLLATFYAAAVQDAVLAPVFARMSPEHVEHVGAFIAEVFGGPAEYSQRHGGHAAMVRKHAGRALTDTQRKRWMALLLETADQLGVPADPEFRSALVSYLEWGSRLAVINSQPGAELGGEAEMPRWGWGEVKGPYQPGS